jgi:hypothetical protein
MPAFVKLKLSQASGGATIYVNPTNVLSVSATEDPNQTLVLLIDDKAYILEGKLVEIAKSLDY